MIVKISIKIKQKILVSFVLVPTFKKGEGGLS